MKTSWPYVVLVLVIALGAYAGYYFAGSTIKTLVKGEEFAWGVTMRPNALAKYTPKSWDAQLVNVKDLGTKYTRFAWEHDAKPSPEKFTDGLIDKNEKLGLETYLIIESDKPVSSLADPYQSGYDLSFKIATEFKGRIKYYQLLNEGSAEILINGTANGQEAGHYNAAAYTKLFNYMKGMSDGISKGDPSAKKVVTMVYTHYVYLDWLKRDNLDYDVIGIDWYDWMGKFEDKKLVDGTLLYDKLKSYNKTLFFAEINALPGVDPVNSKLKTVVDEPRQAKFISEEATWAWQNRQFIKGFFVLELVDNINTKYPEYFGLVKAEKNAKGVYMPGTKREAFEAYKAVISKYN
jgi:hypothetical protein